MRRNFLRLFLALVFLSGWGLGPSELGESGMNTVKRALAAEPGVIVGRRAPDFQLTDLSGQWTTVNYASRATVLNFWATWCPPCREEMPELHSFVAQYGSQLAFFAVNLEESAEDVQSYFARNGLKMTVLMDKEGIQGKKFRVNAIPTTLIMDSLGVVVFRKTGPVTRAELEGAIANLP